RTGGHLASNLGTVELTIALHYVFNTPEDRLVWDVGHQTYPHKILTGRREGMQTLRQYQGMSGFPKRDESPYDAFGVGHSSTSISAALGMAVAMKRKGEKSRAVAIIGDGAMSAGQAFEGLNNAGVSDANLLVILNDNEMSISPPVGAMTKHLTGLISVYNSARDVAKTVLSQIPALFELAKRVEGHAKSVFHPGGTIFEALGFNYIGPIDGHDLKTLISALQQVREMKGPQFLHVITKKGQGYKLAEVDPLSYHGPGKFDLDEGLKESGCAPTTFTAVFGEWACDMAAADERFVAITPAMCSGSGLTQFEKLFPDRFYDVGIAEQHAVTFAAGLACEGLKPVVAIYSTFLQRAYDQALHDVALQKLPVVFAVDRAGIVGGDGATHMGAYDIAYLRCIPEIGILTPADENECRRLLSTAYAQEGPVAVRYPRGTGAGVCTQSTLEPLPYGKGEVRREGEKVAILAFGELLYPALKAAESLNATVVNMRSVKPLDVALLKKMATTHDYLVTIEDACIAGGAGSAVLEELQRLKLYKPTLLLGLPDQFIEHGDAQTLKGVYGLDADGIKKSIQKFVKQ
ncbi:MAG: 1-deoxy-D-xylulose-5-phosphate synthase, partial [Saezia sp.]